MNSESDHIGPLPTLFSLTPHPLSVTPVSPNVPDFLSKLVSQIIDSSSALLADHVSYEVVAVVANATPIITKVTLYLYSYTHYYQGNTTHV